MAMVQRPNAVGLILCKMVIVEEKTRNVTLANAFQRLAFESFPANPAPFFAYSVLTDGLGDIDVALVVSRCDTLEEIYDRSLHMKFDDPLQQWRLCWRIRSCSFPIPGTYQFGIQANGEPITQVILEVYQRGDDHA